MRAKKKLIYNLVTFGLVIAAYIVCQVLINNGSLSRTFKGQLIYAVGCGFLTTMIRLFANSAEDVSFAILLMNLMVPYINGWSKTKPVGGVDA